MAEKNNEKSVERISKMIVGKTETISKKKIIKAGFDKSYKTTIVGCNRYFTDDVPEETQAELIKKYNIPEVSESGIYYTFQINGNWYVKSSNNDFKLYEEVVVRVPNGNWDNMFIEVQRDTIGESGSGVGKNVGNASEIFNRYEGSNANVIDGGYAAHAEGSQNTITGASLASHAEGSENRIIRSKCGHTEGNFTSLTDSDFSHTEGQSNHINGASWAHAGGYGSHIMSGADCGFAHGYGARVLGAVSAALGYQTLAAGRNQLVAGEGNIEDTEDKYSLIIGNGTGIRGLSGFAPSNALTLDRDGNLWVAGTISAEGGGTGGKTYTAGDGISIADSKISVKPATKTTLGGVKAGEGIDISSDGTISTENKQSLTAGDGIAITDDVVSVKVGNGLEISADGAVSVTGGEGGSYTAGSGIEITDENSINLKQATDTSLGGIILGEGLEYDSATGKTNTVPNIQQAVIIQEADAKYLLHEYTTVDYIAGNKIVYAGVGESIIVQGYITRKNSGSINVAINGDDPDADGSKFEAACAEYSFHTSISLDNACYSYNSSQPYYITKIETVYEKWDSTYTYYDLVLTKADGTTEKLTDIDTRNSAGAPNGLTLVYGEIYAPGVVFNGYSSDTGFVVAYLGYKNAPSTNGMIYHRSVTVNTLWKFYIPFASLAEYNAAVGLTYEPNTLTNVEETITEV